MTHLAATGADRDAARELSRAAAFAGRVRLALEREPEAAGAVEGVRTDLALADGACGARTVKEVWLHGAPACVGYLGGLRANPGAAGAPLRAGFSLLAQVRREGEAAFDLTSIATDNMPARRLLERGARGLPRYLPWCRYRSWWIPTRRGREAPRLEAAPPPGLLDAPAQTHPLAERWDAPRLADPRRGRGLRGFLTGDRATLGLWDLRPFKQIRVTGYAPGWRLLRPLLGLPKPGGVLRTGFAGPAGFLTGAESETVELLQELRGQAPDLDHLAIGAAEGTPLFAALSRAFDGPLARFRRFDTTLYLVAEPGSAGEAAAQTLVRSGSPHLEAALL